MVDVVGFEPTMVLPLRVKSPPPSSSRPHVHILRWSRQDSNLRPPVSQTGALSAELRNLGGRGRNRTFVVRLSAECSTIELHVLRAEVVWFVLGRVPVTSTVRQCATPWLSRVALDGHALSGNNISVFHAHCCDPRYRLAARCRVRVAVFSIPDQNVNRFFLIGSTFFTRRSESP